LNYEEGWRYCISFSKACSKEAKCESYATSGSNSRTREKEQERVIEENVNPMPPPPPPHPEATQEQEEERVIEEIVNPTPPPPPPPLPPSAPPTYDVSRLPNDPGERQPIASFHANDHDAIRRAYILRGPFQPYAHEFQKGGLEIENVISILCGFTIFLGLNIV
jgi:hypothetical protein